MAAARVRAEQSVQEQVEGLKDILDDDALFPFNLLVLSLDYCFSDCIGEVAILMSKAPCSALLHLMVIELMPVYFLCYSVSTLLQDMVCNLQGRQGQNLSAR